jgi:hypothetical protein
MAKKEVKMSSTTVHDLTTVDGLADAFREAGSWEALARNTDTPASTLKSRAGRLHVQKFLELEELFVIARAQSLVDAFEHWATCMVVEYSCEQEAQFRTDDGFVASSWKSLRKVIHDSLENDFRRLLVTKGLLPEEGLHESTQHQTREDEKNASI